MERVTITLHQFVTFMVVFLVLTTLILSSLAISGHIDFRDDSIKVEAFFNSEPYRIEKVPPGAYKLKYIVDVNQDGIWNTGNWEMKIQPEKVVNYPSEVMIRSNWDLQIDWSILE